MQFSVSDALTVARQRERERKEILRMNAMLRQARPAGKHGTIGLLDRLFRARGESRRTLDTCETCAAA